MLLVHGRGHPGSSLRRAVSGVLRNGEAGKESGNGADRRTNARFPCRLAVSYQALDWLGISLAWINWAPMQKLDSSYRQGIISTDYDAFTTIQLGATITIDKLVARYWRKQ